MNKFIKLHIIIDNRVNIQQRNGRKMPLFNINLCACIRSNVPTNHFHLYFSYSVWLLCRVILNEILSYHALRLTHNWAISGINHCNAQISFASEVFFFCNPIIYILVLPLHLHLTMGERENRTKKTFCVSFISPYFNVHFQFKIILMSYSRHKSQNICKNHKLE